MFRSIKLEIRKYSGEIVKEPINTNQSEIEANPSKDRGMYEGNNPSL
jgi:hypothetical protein